MTLGKILKQILSLSGLLIFTTVIIFVVFYQLHRNKELKAYPKYTVGETTNLQRTARGGRRVEYVFSYKGKTYNFDQPYRDDVIVPGGKYVVKFSHRNPKINEILFNIPVPDSIKNPPDCWDTIPKFKK